MGDKLFIIDSYPTANNRKQVDKVLNRLLIGNQKVGIFLIDYGVFWMLDEFWDTLFREDVFYYANVHDAEKFSIPFKDEVVFSGMPALEQLMATSEDISKLKEDRIFPESLLTHKT